MSKILIVEDAEVTRNVYREALAASHDLTFASSVAQGVAAGSAPDFDLMLFDVTLPDGDGFELCRRLAAVHGAEMPPFLFITGRYDLQDKLEGFALGAEDYVVKPLDGRELKARVDIRLRRRPEAASKGAAPASVNPAAPGLRFDLGRLRVTAREGETERDLGLTPNEFRLLSALLAQPGRVLTRAELLAAGWGTDVHVLERTIDRHVSSLRRKLGAHASGLAAVPGQGYSWVVRQG